MGICSRTQQTTLKYSRVCSQELPDICDNNKRSSYKVQNLEGPFKQLNVQSQKKDCIKLNVPIGISVLSNYANKVMSSKLSLLIFDCKK